MPLPDVYKRQLYEQMMPLCGDMAGVAKGIAGLGALFYVCLLYTSTLYWAAMPGNAADFPAEESFHTACSMKVWKLS